MVGTSIIDMRLGISVGTQTEEQLSSHKLRVHLHRTLYAFSILKVGI